MAIETYGRAGLELPVPGTSERYILAREIENLKKLSTHIDEQLVKLDELYSSAYRTDSSDSESIASLGTVNSGWKVTSWVFHVRGFMCLLRVAIERTGNDITTGASGNISNQDILTVQPRFRPRAQIGLSNSSTGGLVGGVFRSTGVITATATVPNRGIKKNEKFTFAGVYIKNTPGLA